MAAQRFGNTPIDKEIVKKDRRKGKRIGPCAFGERAMYLNSFFISRRYYVPYEEVERVYKRIAMSQGGFSGKGVFGSLPYLVVVLKDGREKACNFKIEEEVDEAVRFIRERHPEIHIGTLAGEEARAKREAERRAGRPAALSREAENAAARLRNDLAFLEMKPEIGEALARSVRRKRQIDRIPSSTRLLAWALLAAGALLALGGLCLFAMGKPAGPYMLLFGAAFLLFALASGILPFGSSSPKTVKEEWEKALKNAKNYISGKPDFFFPPQYAHPIVIERTLRLIEEGKARNEHEAWNKMKNELKALNSSVRVSQEEHDEVAAVKPLFLECGYKDGL
ncbi:MAG: ATPase P [Lachnospiraceae bacterium]|nr:ATPase P [Lachnospiraceae bacterium]